MTGQSSDSFSRTDVVEIIKSALTKAKGSPPPNEALYQELEQLAQYIENIRTELAQSRSQEINRDHIPVASDELDAVVGETAKATGAIMDACEHLEKESSKMAAAQRDEVTNQITRIYEACSFQDITGQRISKVVKTLKHIESKVGEILDALDHRTTDKGRGKEGGSPATLLNGPQLPGAGVSQDEIDRLLSGFGK